MLLSLLFLFLGFAVRAHLFVGAMVAVAQADVGEGPVVVAADVDGEAPADFNVVLPVFFFFCNFSARARRYPSASDRFAKATRCTCVRHHEA